MVLLSMLMHLSNLLLLQSFSPPSFKPKKRKSSKLQPPGSPSQSSLQYDQAHPSQALKASTSSLVGQGSVPSPRRTCLSWSFLIKVILLWPLKEGLWLLLNLLDLATWLAGVTDGHIKHECPGSCRGDCLGCGTVRCPALHHPSSFKQVSPHVQEVLHKMWNSGMVEKAPCNAFLSHAFTILKCDSYKHWLLVELNKLIHFIATRQLCMLTGTQVQLILSSHSWFVILDLESA